MKMKFRSVLLACVVMLTCFKGLAQTVYIDHKFQSVILPSGVTSNGAISPTKAADGVCTQGMIQLNSGQFMQIDVPASSVFSFNAKSTSSTARVVTIKYKKRYEAAFTSLAPTLSIQTAATFNLIALFPVLVATDSISVRIEAGGNIQVHDLYVAGTASASNAALITAFKLPGQSGVESIFPGNDSIAIQMPLSVDISNMVPQEISISPNATIFPAANIARDFTTLVNYAVTAQDGVTIRNWKVNTIQVASAAKDITAFTLAANQIGVAEINATAATVKVFMPIGASLSSIVPLQFAISDFATVAPLATTAQNFSAPVMYTITAQDNTTKNWTVSVELIDPSAVFTDYQAEDAEFTGKADNSHANYTGTGFVDFLAGGENFINFTICQAQAGNQTAKFRYSIAKDEVRQGSLFVNDVFIRTFNFPRTNAFSDWSEEVAVINLPAGISKIKLTWETTDGPNLDKLSLSGTACQSYTLNVTSTNNGKVAISPERINKQYFENETVTLSAENLPALVFDNWSGDISGSVNPVTVTMNANKTIVANFTVIPTYKLITTITGLGEVVLNPAGGEYPVNTIVSLTAKSVLGSAFLGWAGDASGINPVTSVTMDGIKNVTANFSSSVVPNFERVTGFASINGDGFTGPVTGGQCAPDTLVINGPAEFNKLCESLYNRERAFRTNTVVGGMKKAPLVILIKAGVYDNSQPLSETGAKAFGNDMLDIAEQSELTFIGESNVVFKFGINVKRSVNIIIRNISFYEYEDDGINVGYPETHHIWIDHCNFGHPTTLPVNKDEPDGGCEIKDGASFVTVSWCKFQNHWKTSLNGHSDNNGATDAGRLKITYYANYFYNTNSRNPRVRFGQVHVLNNFFENTGLGRSGQLGYGIAASNNSQVVAESNFFLDTRWPMFADRTKPDFSAVYGPNLESPTGNRPCFGIKPINNAYSDEGLTQSLVGKVAAGMLNPGGMSIKFDSLTLPTFNFDPAASYDYSSYLLPASALRSLIPFYAGADKVSFGTSCNILPVTLISFSGKAIANQHQLNWKVEAEANLAGYEVERSHNGDTFNKIGTIAVNEQNQQGNYLFVDAKPLTGKNFYRLTMRDKDGSVAYSKVILLQSGMQGKLTIWPNPASDAVQVNHPLVSVKGIISIINAQGVQVMEQKVSTGVSNTTLQTGKLASGVYWLLFTTNGEKTSVRFTKL
jgi:pectate lyase